MNTIFSFLLTLVEFVLAFGVLIFLHEFGHYIACKAFKIEVEEFGFGLPPKMLKLFSFQGTDFTLNWLPVGAFVRPKGEDDPAVPGGLATSNPWKKLTVAASGPVMNMLVGVTLFAYMISRIGIVAQPYQVEIMSLMEGRPAKQAGLAAGDIITKINGEPIDSVEEMISIVKANKGKEITLTYLRDRESKTIQITPLENVDSGELGVSISYHLTKINVLQAIPYGVQATWDQIRLILKLPGMLLRGEVSKEMARPVGPVGIFQIFQQVRETDIETAQAATKQGEKAMPGLLTLNLIAILSVGLGFANLLPIPGLDGSRILFALPEIIIKKRLPPAVEQKLLTYGIAFLLILMAIITAQDIFNPVQLK